MATPKALPRGAEPDLGPVFVAGALTVLGLTVWGSIRLFDYFARAAGGAGDSSAPARHRRAHRVDMRKTLHEIARDHAVLLRECEVNHGLAFLPRLADLVSGRERKERQFVHPSEVEDYRDQSFAAGADVLLGFYDDIEKKQASFFHEVGHIVDDRGGRRHPARQKEIRYDRELTAWRVGLSLAQLNGYLFSEETIAWCDAQLATYVGWEEREVLRWVTPEPSRRYDRQVLRRYSETIRYEKEIA